MRTLAIAAGIGFALSFGRSAAPRAADVESVRKRAVELVCEGPGKTELSVRNKILVFAESAWKEGCALFAVDATPRETPVELHVYEDVPTYEAACDRLVAGKFKRNLAFAHHETCSAHVVMQPAVRGAARQRIAPTRQTLNLVVHELAHVVRIAKFPNYASHPDWIADGAASWLETRVAAAEGLGKDPEEEPYFAAHALRGRRLVLRSRVPSVDALVHDRTDDLGFYDLYSVRYLFFRFLASGSRARELAEFMQDLRRSGSGGDFVERAADALRSRLAIQDWSELDGEFRGWIEGLAPRWDEVVRTLETSGDEWTQSAFEDTYAACFRVGSAGTRPFAIEGEVTVLEDRALRPQMNVLLGRQQLDGDLDRWVSVALVPGHGVTVFDHDESREPDARWKNLVHAPVTSTATGKPIAFRVECTTVAGSTTLSVAIDGKSVAKTTIDRSLDGPWGLGAQAGSSGSWRGVRLVPISGR